MASKKISAVNLLPEYFKTIKNTKFLSSTLDQLIQKPELESIDGYVGSQKTPTYKTDDVYISNGNPYQLDPAIVFYDSLQNIQGAQGYDDFINEIAAKGGHTNDLNRLLKSKCYSYDPHIDWDKLVNYQNYFWMPYGPETLEVPTSNLDIENDIMGLPQAVVEVLLPDGTTSEVQLSNGMMLSFGGHQIDNYYHNKEFFVEGVGSSIKLISFDKLVISESFLSTYPDGFDANTYDTLPYDNNRELPNIRPEYVTINRASNDLNPWSRYNRWVHKDVIRECAMLNGVDPDLSTGRAQRPIIEFVPNIKLHNYGANGIVTVDIMDTDTVDPFNTVEGSTVPVYLDGVLLENGHRVIFNAPSLEGIKGNVYEVVYVIQNGVPTLTLTPTYEPVVEDSITVLLGDENNGTEWWFDGSLWVYAQQKEFLNQAPLFELFDQDGNSYADKTHYLSDFTGNKIFSYAQGTGTVDPYLGFPISYKTATLIGSILFDNNLCADSIVVSELLKPTYTISANSAYIKIGTEYKNAWTQTADYEIPVLSSTATGILSYYEEPLGLTNNPLNGISTQFNISELTQHFATMVDRLPPAARFVPVRDKGNFTRYGTALISNDNPLSFAQVFLGKKENDLIRAIEKSSDQYGNFKLTFINKLRSVSDNITPIEAVDQILTELNQDKVYENSYYFSDMVGYGVPESVRSWTVSRLYQNNPSFPLTSDFDLSSLSTRAIYVYRNGEQLVHGLDYVFNTLTTTLDIMAPLEVGDVIKVNDYQDTTANYIPLTPSKLGLYPKFAPSMFVDNSYVLPQTVIQGHDGSIMVAYGDYRDAIILELEKRIYNNIKGQYNTDLFDINSVLPGAFRTSEYTLDEVNNIIEGDFVKWASKFGIDYVLNNSFDAINSKTWNFNQTYIPALDINFSGSLRGLLLTLYGTDKPHIAPWEMLGIYEKPTWWEATYGPAPYTNGNLILWTDIAEGKINGTVNHLYVRNGLLDIIPTDENGDLIDPASLITDTTDAGIRKSWSFGDVGPAELAWRRSSYYPFAVQRLLALTKPADYCSKLYDPSRMTKNIAGQWTYGDLETFLKLDSLVIYGDNNALTSGYSAFISEIGCMQDKGYIANLKQDLVYSDYRLFCKLNGYADKDTLQVIIDAYEPTSTAPGSVLPSQNYTLWFNKSNTLQSLAISGLIIQRVDGGYSVRGYDKQDSYFNIFKPLRNIGTQSLTVGGISEKYLEWQPSGTSGNTGLSSADTTSASSPTGTFYSKGQYVLYDNAFYRTTVAHRASSSFNSDYFQRVPKLPTRGGATVQLASTYDQTVTVVPYGTFYSNIQEVYDLIVGYGRWLESQGFVFNEYNSDLDRVLDWNLTAEEFLFWSTQNWDIGALITLSPFANSITCQTSNTVVDNLFDRFYDYSILGANGQAYPKNSLSILRDNGVCLIQTNPNTDGIYFARLNLVQKDHAIVFDNETIFNDVIYNTKTGNRQRRVKLVGFKTAGWDGGLTSPGFVYDKGESTDWTANTPYIIGDVVRFNEAYYAANQNVERSPTFDFSKWDVLGGKPVPALLPNFDYKISQFEDFYSLDSDNFDAAQQKLAQHLTGYTPRVYLNNIFPDPIAQYKFYQGFIREKGTKNAVDKLAKISQSTQQGNISYNEEWAFRVGHFGSFRTYKELETPLIEGSFLENPQILNFVSEIPSASANDLIHYVEPSDLTITPDGYIPASVFSSTTSTDSLLLQHSGYVRIGDVTATAYNENSLLDIANAGQLKDGDTIWLGFTSDGSWDILKYTYIPAEVVGVFISNPLSSLTFTTNYPHTLQVGQIIGINQLNSQVDGIYKVIAINNSKQFTVASTLANITNAPLPAPGQLYAFESSRVDTYDSLPSDEQLFRDKLGTKHWIDNNDENSWAVYEKVDNFSHADFIDLRSGTGFGRGISKAKDSTIIVVGAPANSNGIQQGRISLLEKQTNGTYKDIVRWRIGSAFNNVATGFGSCVVYDTIPFTGSVYGLVFAGAPLVNTVKVSSINSRDLIEGQFQYITETSIGFGKSIFVEKNSKTKLVLIGSSDSVYSYTVSDNAGNILVNSNGLLVSGYNINSIVGSDDASVVAVGIGNAVKVYNKSLDNIQTISVNNQTVAVSTDGSYLFVGDSSASNDNGSLGRVYVYKTVNGQFTLDHIIYNPVVGLGMNFGISIDVTTDNRSLVISATGTNGTLSTTFDSAKMTLDGGITNIKGTELETGTVYSYYRKDSRFVYAQEITTQYVISNPGTNFGTTVRIDDTEVIVSMPAESNPSVKSGFIVFTREDVSVSGLKLLTAQDTFIDLEPINRIALIDTDKDQIIEYLDVYDPLKGRIPGIAEQELSYKFMNDPAVYSVGITGVNVDADKNWLDEHVGELWWDLSTAKYQWYEQGDLEYRRNNWGKLFPGATIDVYEWVGTTLLPTEWLAKADTVAGLAKGISGQPKYLDNSVVSAKQVYDPVTNSFSNVYYYWVKNKTVKPNNKNRRISAYDVASAIADPKAFGLKYASVIDNNAIMLSNIGGIPVSNKISINIAQDVATEFVQSPKHTQWYILDEGSSTKMPPEYLEKKLFDSLLGHDKLGNLVPDPMLSDRTKYGIGVRPRQSMFKDRHSALRNIIEFANDVLLSTPITGYRSFTNLNAQEKIPDQYRNLYDHLVEDTVTLDSLDTQGYEQAILNCSIDSNGSVNNIVIAQAGFGYGNLNPVYSSTGTIVGYEGPTFTVDDAIYATTFDNNLTTFDGTRTKFVTKDEPNKFAEGLYITTVVDEYGSVIRASIVNSGKRFGANFRLISRPHTVIVQSDDTYNGKWTRFEWDYTYLTWNRAHTQSYNTSLYWDYVDYASADYNKYQIYSSVIGNQYDLPSLSLLEGQYVKINNGGDGNYVVLRKTPVGVYGSYGNGYDLVYRQNGTIQFNSDLWRVRDNPLNWDYVNTYDQTLWDQTPDVELEYIFAALKHDLFVYELKSNWNKLFFKAVRYALTEQKMLDWAFKTSFITLTHTLGELTQPPVYKMQDSSYYEDYVKEVKPYHTQIREFVTKYTVTETATNASSLLSLANTDIAEIEITPSITLKFDRTSFDNTVGNFEVLDTFVSNGIDRSFELSWVPAFDKSGIVVKFDGIIALGSQWSVNYVERMFNGFHKQYATLEVFGVEPLDAGSVVTVSYKKNAEQLNETERVLAYYTSTYGVVGLDLTTLVDGIGYPGLQVGGQYEGPGFANTYGGVTPDSLVTGGTWINGERNTALGINPEDLTISGEVGFINTFSGHAPSEMLPGFVVDSLGLNVYTVGHALSPTITNGNVEVIASEDTQGYALPELPASVDSISVVLNNSILDYTTDALVVGDNKFSIDWENSLLLIPPQVLPGLLHYSLIGVGGGTNNFGFVEHDVAFINSDSGVVESSVLAIVVQDVYVTVNGIPTSNVTLDVSLENNGPASVTVTNLDPLKTNVVQVWFFTETHDNFDQIVEQTSYSNSFELTSTGTHIVELIQNGAVERVLESQYSIVGNILTVEPSLVNTGDIVKVITFIDTTGSLGITTEEFVGNAERRVVMSAPVANDYYIWVSIVGSDGTTNTLVNGLDFVILEDNLTIQISDEWSVTSSDTIQIISFKSPDYVANVLGYRMFKDMLGGTTYTRYSLENTTYLTQSLSSTDTEIYLADASVLTPPVVEENIPGVILINSERIEFYQIDGNVLKQITRGTLGTGVNDYITYGTQVFDQGTDQLFDTSETVDIQYFYTSTATNEYQIYTVDTETSVPNSDDTISSKGIVLDTTVELTDQVEVYLGGYLLSKDPVYKHDTAVRLDNILLDTILGTITSVTEIAGIANANAGDSYVDLTDGKVWTYTRTRTDNLLYPGWVFSGITRVVDYEMYLDGSVQKIKLNNIDANGIEVAIVKKHSRSDDFNTVISTTTTETLWDSTSGIAIFLKQSPTRLPKNLTGAGDSTLRDEQGRALTNENEQPLTGNI